MLWSERGRSHDGKRLSDYKVDLQRVHARVQHKKLYIKYKYILKVKSYQ